jgi:ribosomal protein S18 acetylase RimI-like enzyme
MTRITVRKMTPSDFAFAIRLTDTMHWDLTERDFRFVMALNPESGLVALDGDKEVGITTIAHFDKIGTIGNVIVDARYRSKGIGARLMKEAIMYLSAKSATTIALYAYLDTVKFYEKIGFKTDSDFIRLVGQGTESQTDANAIRRMTQHDLEDAIDFDRACMGWNREKLLRRIFAESKDLCYVARKQSKQLGFIMADWYRQEIGPLMYRADSDDEAISLLKTVLSKLKGFEVRIGVSEARQEVVDALVDLGFKEEFRVTLMHLGAKLPDTGCLVAMESLERG